MVLNNYGVWAEAVLVAVWYQVSHPVIFLQWYQ